MHGAVKFDTVSSDSSVFISTCCRRNTIEKWQPEKRKQYNTRQQQGKLYPFKIKGEGTAPTQASLRCW